MTQNTFDKDLVTGSYDLVALDILNEGPLYAYGMIRKIDDQSKRLIRWREGTVYRVLHDLERRGLVVGQWLGPRQGRRRKYYRITERGRRTRRALRRQWQDFSRALDNLLTHA